MANKNPFSGTPRKTPIPYQRAHKDESKYDRKRDKEELREDVEEEQKVIPMNYARLTVKKSDLEKLLGTEENTKGYLFFFKDDLNYYSICSVETSKSAGHLFDDYNDLDRAIRDRIMISCSDIKVVPYHHQDDPRQAGQNFITSAEMKEKSGSYLDLFCLVTKKEFELFTLKRDGGATYQQELDFKTIDDSKLPERIVELIEEKRKYISILFYSL